MLEGSLRSAQVVMRPARGEVPAEAVSSSNLEAYLPTEQDAERARSWFAEQGFEVGALVGISFSISGPAELFDRLDLAGGGEELSLEALPEDVARSVRAIGVSPPPDFGPGAP